MLFRGEYFDRNFAQRNWQQSFNLGLKNINYYLSTLSNADESINRNQFAIIFKKLIKLLGLYCYCITNPHGTGYIMIKSL